MAITYGELAAGQNPSATTLTDGLTAAANLVVVVTVTNRGAASSFRLSIAPLGAVDALTQYKAYDRPLGDNGVYEAGPFFMKATDVLRVYATDARLTFTFNGASGF